MSADILLRGSHETPLATSIFWGIFSLNVPAIGLPEHRPFFSIMYRPEVDIQLCEVLYIKVNPHRYITKEGEAE